MPEPEMLDCQEAAARLDDYVDRELSPAELEAVAAHLRRCACCAPVFRFQEGMLRRLQDTVGRIHAPENLLDRIMDRLREAEAGRDTDKRSDA